MTSEVVPGDDGATPEDALMEALDSGDFDETVEAAGEDPVEEPPEEEEAETAEDEPQGEEELEEEVDEAPDEEPLPDGVRSKKASERFRQLANEKNEYRDRVAKLEAQLEERLRRSPDEDRLLQMQLKAFEQQEEQADYTRQQREYMQIAFEMQQLGFDPNDPVQVQDFTARRESQKQIQSLQDQVQSLKTLIDEQKKAQADADHRQQWQHGLFSAMQEELKGYKIDDQKFQELSMMAWRNAAAGGIHDPAAAAKALVSSISPFLEAAKKPRAPKADDRVMRGVAAKGAKGNTKPAKPKDDAPPEDALDEIFSGRAGVS